MSEVVIHVNTRSGEGRTQAHALSRRLTGRLLAQGVKTRSMAFDVHGGGTVLVLAKAVLDREGALGFVALGSANLLLRDLGLPSRRTRRRQRGTDPVHDPNRPHLRATLRH